jgi:cytochrome c peroxidase
MTRIAPLALLGWLAACGGEAATSEFGTTPTTPITPTTPTTPSVAAIRAALTIEPTALPNYAAPVLPAHYVGLVGGPQDNGRTAPMTNAGATLGRVLFFDRALSTNQTRSCASCHTQATGFSDGERFSLGIDGVSRTPMHSMRLANARFYTPGTMFWDKRAASVEAQSLQPVQDPVEMGFDAAHGGLDALVTRMRGLAYYPELFQLAFGDTAITSTRMQSALAQYVRSLVSAGSKWDAGYAQVFNAAAPDRGVNTPIPTFTAQENRGRQLFFQPPPQGGAGCAGCHVAPTFALAPNSLSNGLDAGETRIFKSPSLKNVAVGGPFMHDGRFATLEQVVAFYNGGIQPGPALDQRLRGPNGQPLRLGLSQADQAALVAFLRTLTDDALLADAKFSDPFRR